MKYLKIHRHILFFYVCSSVFMMSILSCESKVKEKEAAPVAYSENVDSKIKAQAELDHKIEQLQSYLNRIQAAFNTWKSLLKIDANENTSVFDILIKANQASENQFVNFEDASILQNGTLELQSSLLKDDCKKVEYEINSESLNPLNKLSYGLKSCATANNFLTFAQVEFTDNNIKLNFNMQNLNDIFPVDVLKIQTADCSFSLDKTNPHGSCNRLQLTETKDLKWVTDIKISNQLDATIIGYSKSDTHVVYQINITIASDGTVKDAKLEGPFE